MINIKFLLGIIPKTANLEAKEADLIKEFEELKIYKDSEEIKHFFELKKFVESPDLKSKMQEIKSLNFKKTTEFQKEKEYYSLKKSAKIKNYYKVLNSALYKNFEELKDSKDLTEYFELKTFIESEDFKLKKNSVKALNYKNTEEFNKEQEFLKLQKSTAIKNYFKIEASEIFKLYQSLNGSKELNQYLELQKFAVSEETKNIEKEIKTARFENTPEFEKLKEYEALKKSVAMKNYFKLLQSKVYNIYRQLHQSEEIEQFNALKEYLNSTEIAELKKDKKSFIQSEAFQKELSFKKLNSDKNLKTYFSFIQSSAYSEFLKVEKSSDLEKLDILENFVKSEEFITIHNYYKISPQKRWNQREEFQKVLEFSKLKKEKKFIDYFKFENSKQFKLFNDSIKSGIVEKFKTLKEFVQSDDFKKIKDYMLLPFLKKWEQTNEYNKSEAFVKFGKEQRIIDYLKFTSSKEFDLFNEVLNSGEIKHYEELEVYINSDDFKTFKSYMILPFKNKWEQTKEYAKLQDFTNLKKSEKIKWYFQVIDSKKFDELKQWNITFYEDFDKPKLDKNKWLTRFYWGDKMIHDTYSLSADKHFVTDGDNLSIENSILKIETRRENASGKAWHPLMGFAPKEFEFTSGLINTGKSFRQQYGRFKAKIKVHNNKVVTHAFWLVGNYIMPQIDIIKYLNGKISLSTFWGNIADKNDIHRNSSKLFGYKLSTNFFIYELEWTPNELIWKINGQILKREKNGIPNEPMYILFSSGIFGQVNGHKFPAALEIDWVKCFEKV